MKFKIDQNLPIESADLLRLPATEKLAGHPDAMTVYQQSSTQIRVAIRLFPRPQADNQRLGCGFWQPSQWLVVSLRGLRRETGMDFNKDALPCTLVVHRTNVSLMCAK